MTTVLITGASGGIGRALALELGARNFDLVLVARNTIELRRLAQQIRDKHPGVGVTTHSVDLAQPGAASALIQALGDAPIDILVNNAGSGEFGKFQEVDWPRYAGTLQLNMVALTELTHGLLPAMLRRQTGQIVNIASTASFQPLPWMAVYGATKAYVLSLSEALAYELRGSGVKVLAFCPGATHSGFASAAQAQQSNNFKEGHTASPESVARAIAKQIAGQRGGVSVHGTMNAIMAALAPVSPRAIVLRMTDRTMKPV